VSKDEVLLVSMSGGGTKKPSLRKCQIYQAAFLSFGVADHLVVASSQGVQSWSEGGENVEWFRRIDDALEGSHVDTSQEELMQFHFMRGLTSFPCTSLRSDVVAVGTSIGTIDVLREDGELACKIVTGMESPISALASSSRFIACGNDQGSVFAYSTEMNEKGSFVSVMCLPGLGEPVTAICCRDTAVIAGFTTGHIRLYWAHLGSLALEITAHVRGITGLSLHHNNNYIASCSDDTFVNVWTLPDGVGVSMDLAFQEKLENRMCTGIAWLPDGKLCAASYDDDDLVLFSPR